MATMESVPIDPDVVAVAVPEPAKAEIVIVAMAPDVAAPPEPEPANAVNATVPIEPVAFAFVELVAFVRVASWPANANVPTSQIIFL
jgi:hypothetical protein